jgi:teichuronic acid biosynthesis glycosyltransferase TuaH
MGRTASLVQRLERRRVAEADAVLAVSQPILDRLARGGQVLPNGCDPDAFHSAECHPAPPDVQLARPIAGVVGQLSPRIDLALLEAVADSGTSLLLVGPTVGGMDEDRFAKLSGRDNVAWVGAKSFEDLPPYLGVMDVGLTPYVDTPFNRASFPLKTLEYLSAGLPVVSTPLPAVSALDTDLVSVASCPTEFADVVAAVIAAGTSRAIVDERRQFARRHGWDTRASDLMRVLARPVPRVA